MDLFTLGVGMFMEQGLRVFPAGQSADFANAGLVNDVRESYRDFHYRWCVRRAWA